MNKKVRQIILLLWIGTTSLLDFLLALFTYPLITFFNYANDGPPYYEQNSYYLPIHEIVINQVLVSFLFLLFGIAWSSIILLGTERLLSFLRFPTPGNNKFTHLSLGLLKFALITIVCTILASNIYLIYDQIQGRGGIGSK
ncbi:hypothetical protein [Chamaesiphon minutus]|uniref:Uncharacterized protein n=1 Tax=Chamaesiphon minutus (strain ATCC 27169 / PCC 6605) TaxID=1173020 RepID=K9UJ23_CHAP6|nr:hypothetical protein [Chamaesiphon minutus]AFY94441.1 hypothetical protein Cha6605_3449 [Chamaesiphon minutus PCC 6605]